MISEGAYYTLRLQARISLLALEKRLLKGDPTLVKWVDEVRKNMEGVDEPYAQTLETNSSSDELREAMTKALIVITGKCEGKIAPDGLWPIVERIDGLKEKVKRWKRMFKVYDRGTELGIAFPSIPLKLAELSVMESIYLVWKKYDVYDEYIVGSYMEIAKQLEETAKKLSVTVMERVLYPVPNK